MSELFLKNVSFFFLAEGGKINSFFFSTVLEGPVNKCDNFLKVTMIKNS